MLTKRKEWKNIIGGKKKAYKGMPGTRSEKNSDESSEDANRPKFLSNHTHYSTTNPDARIAVKPGKPRQFNYLARLTKLKQIQRGWINYFRMANIQAKPLELDSWLRNRLRYCIWQVWKKPERRRISDMPRYSLRARVCMEPNAHEGIGRGSKPYNGYHDHIGTIGSARLESLLSRMGNRY